MPDIEVEAAIDASMEAEAGIDPLIQARPYNFRVVGTYDGKPTPLVIMLHGYTANAMGEENYVKFSNVQKTFLYAFPDGLKDNMGYRFWNATDACCNFSNIKVDDVAYISAIIEDVAMHYNLDRRRVFVFGHSNGGFMAHRLGCDLASKIAAIASLAGAQWNDPSKCNPSAPVAALEIHGTSDQTILYAGSTIVNVPYPGARTTVATWAAKNTCMGRLTDTMMPIDLDSSIPGPETTVERYMCTTGAAELWSINGGSHIPILQPTFASYVYGFFEAHPKP